MTFTIRKEFKPKNLNGISEKQVEEHWKLYEGYVNQSNALDKQLAEMRAEGKTADPLYADRRRRFAFEYGGMVMHEYYFANLKADVDPKVADEFQEAVAEKFGSFDAWKADFAATGATRGIGWAVCFYDPLTGDINNHFIQEHAFGNLPGFIPLIAMDVWEHAYLFDVGALERGKHIEAFISNINWEVVAERFEKAMKGKSFRFESEDGMGCCSSGGGCGCH